MAIFRAIPQGARRARGQASWLRAVQAHPAVARLRADAHRNLISIARVLAHHADWVTLTTRPTWAVLMRRTSLSRSTIAAWVRWLRVHGLLGTVVHGSTPRYRSGPDDGKGNLAAEYVLAEPQAEDEQVSAPVGKTRTPSRFSKETLFSPSRAREKNWAVEPVTDRSWPRTATPESRRDMLKAAERARAESLTLRRLSARHVRSLLRPVWRLGGTVADALYMLDHTPDGRPWGYVGMPRYVPGWVRHRLAAWLTEDGQLRPGVMLPSQRSAAKAAARRVEQERVRAERAELESRRAKDVASLASRARAILAASSSRAASVLRRRALGIA